MNGKLFSTLVHALNIQVCLVKLLRFGTLTCQILTALLQSASIETELSKFDMLALQNATVCLHKLECFKRVTTRKKFRVHSSSKMVGTVLILHHDGHPTSQLSASRLPTGYRQATNRLHITAS